MLAAGTVPSLPGLGAFVGSVKVNIEKNTALNVRDGAVSESIAALKPGQRFDLLYRVHPNTRQVIVVLSDVTPALPPAGQNQLFGDDILLTVHSAKTSAIGEGDYKVFEFSPGGGTFVVDDPEEGIMRVTVNGDWTNAGEIGAAVSVYSRHRSGAAADAAGQDRRGTAGGGPAGDSRRARRPQISVLAGARRGASTRPTISISS